PSCSTKPRWRSTDRVWCSEALFSPRSPASRLKARPSVPNSPRRCRTSSALSTLPINRGLAIVSPYPGLFRPFRDIYHGGWWLRNAARLLHMRRRQLNLLQQPTDRAFLDLDILRVPHGMHRVTNRREDHPALT